VTRVRHFALAVALALSAAFSAAQITLAASPPPPACRYDDVLTQHRAMGDWKISLLDPIYMVSRNYVPGNLVSVANANIQGSGRVRQFVIDDLAAMAAAARKHGTPIKVTSAYRSWGEQSTLFRREVNRFGLKNARESVARPGHSEHQLGTTIDFTSGNSNKKAWAYNDWSRTPAGQWMRNNAWKYGFLLSYPHGYKSKTCYRYEPWHFRYVGREMAADVRGTGLTLREYIWSNFE
jgi:D-alanyl-D-alanine carboxypeptidase